MELGKAKAIVDKIAEQNNTSIQIAWDMLFFDEIIYRLSKSKYKDRLIFKGGLYLQSITGISTRSTMDMDFKLVGSELTTSELMEIFIDLCDSNSESNIHFKVHSISDITAETKYGGKTVKISASFFNVKKIFGIDIGFGDIVTPSAINYQYESLINSEKYNILAYPIETIIAEKFETLISKGENNSRAKDFYDLYLLNGMTFDLNLLNAAMINTFNLRNTIYDKKVIDETLKNVFEFDRIEQLYENYKQKNKFVGNVTFDMCKNAIYNIFNKLIFNKKIILEDYNIILHLVRHGQDETNKLGGWSDNKLTKQGKIEVNDLINEIDIDYDVFISSDLLRAKQTSEIINHKLNMNINYNIDFRETNNGILKNLTKYEFNKSYQGLYYSSLNMDEKYPGGESPNEFFDRIKSNFIHLLETNKNKKILLVTHGGVITVIKCLLNGWMYSNKLKIVPKTGTIIKLI